MAVIPISWNSSSLEAVHDSYKDSCYQAISRQVCGCNRAVCNVAILERQMIERCTSMVDLRHA